ncbi:diacylglycerol/lipid kinase family protein [Aestuariirhabdus litorea]|uniref:diacylglycerol/lipid kinase family protein n=1 Tax=Aestuariirhabdus litorea TaxID=2528527 RepID=UPI0013E38899|nr:diacylglycerol kinase family protein [Aestuariirhabdus litorea]
MADYPHKRLLLVVNPTAGRRNQRLLDLTLAHLKVLGWLVERYETRAAGDACAYVESYTGTARLVVAAGGDGTVNEVINGLAARSDRLTLAIIPLGTTNVVARELGLPSSAKELARLMDQNHCQPCYWPRVNGRLFAFSVGVGFDAAVVRGVNLAVKRRWGKLAYGLAALAPWLCWRSRDYQVQVDGQPYRADSILVSNGRFYAGSFVIAERMRLQRPEVQVLLIQAASPLALMRVLLALPLGRFERMTTVRSLTARHLSVQGAGDESLQVDGDCEGALPLTLSVPAEPMPVICAD